MGDSFGARSNLVVDGRTYEIFSLRTLEERGFAVRRLPYSLRVLLENVLRGEARGSSTREEVEALAAWQPGKPPEREIAFTPARVLLQDFTGVPAIVDLAAMRDAVAARGGDPSRVNPLQPVELVVDHSIQVDAFGSREAFAINERLDYERNLERYQFLKWGQGAFRGLKLVPPNTGIVHQVNLEHLARVVFTSDESPSADGGVVQAYPDTLVGTDSHTPMVNGIGVLGWGVGGIEAEAAMLGQPVSMLVPRVVGVRLSGVLREGATATDLVLRVTELLRAHGVVGKFVEFFGPGLSKLSVPDRATIANMSPEFGATCAFFPVDAETLRYLDLTGRPRERVALVEAYAREQGLFRGGAAEEPAFSETLELDLDTIEPSVAGPRRPQERVALSDVRASFVKALPSLLPPKAAAANDTHKDAADGTVVGTAGRGIWGEGSAESPAAAQPSDAGVLDHGSVVIAAITSCTNTSNPSVMLAAGLLARNAARLGLRAKPWVKTSLAPGSKAVVEYLRDAGLLEPLEECGFHVVGFGCTTCIGNSGPLPRAISEEIAHEGLVVAAVLSGNRNFEGRINSDVRANYLMSPPLVVAFALAGRIDADLSKEPLGEGRDGRPVFLHDVWPSPGELDAARPSVHPEVFRRVYGAVLEGDARWRSLPVAGGDRFEWAEASTYVRQPTYLDGGASLADLRGARVLALLGDSVTTDHISPAGSIRADSPAGRYLLERGVRVEDFNSYGSRRGNHEVMMRGTFASVRLRNALVPGTEGGVTRHVPSGETLSIFDAAMRYQREGVPLVVIAGRDYGSGSSRDWAAKGPRLLGVRAVLAESYERIHRSNLVGMGIVPLQFAEGDSAASLGLDGREAYDVVGLEAALAPPFAAGRVVTVRARRDGHGGTVELRAAVRVDTPQELEYVRHGGILTYVLERLLSGESAALPAATPAAVDRRPDETTAAQVDEGSIDSFPASDVPSH